VQPCGRRRRWNDRTTAHQVTQAKTAGFKIDKVVSDEGVSGVSTRLAERPQGRRLSTAKRPQIIQVIDTFIENEQLKQNTRS
jgi:hypothetical protein